MSILMSDKEDFRKNIIRKKGTYMIKGPTYQEDVAILNVYAPKKQLQNMDTRN